MRSQGWSKHFLLHMGILQGRQMISRGIPSLTLIGASVNSRTVLGWLMCSTGCRTMGRPVKSVNAFVNQQLLTHIVMQKKEPMPGPLGHRVSVCCCQTVNTGFAFGCQALMPPSQSLFLTVWAETWRWGSRKWSWCWVVAFPRPLHLSWCLSTDISSMRCAGIHSKWPVEGTYGHSHPGGDAIVTLMAAFVFHLCAYSICTTEGEIDKLSKKGTDLVLVMW